MGAEGRELATALWTVMEATKRRAEKLRAAGKTLDFEELRWLEPDS